jgi:phosphoglycolate phosphatase
VGDGPAVLLARCLSAAGLDHRAEDVLPLYLEAYRRRLLDTTTFYTGVLDTLDALRGQTLAVLTNKPGDLSRALLAGLGAGHRFALVWGGGDVPGRKPEPDGLRRMMAELHAQPQDTVMVGDSAVDIEAGRAASCHTVGVTYGFDPEGVAAARPDAVLGDLRELPPLLHVEGGVYPGPSAS